MNHVTLQHFSNYNSTDSCEGEMIYNYGVSNKSIEIFIFGQEALFCFLLWKNGKKTHTRIVYI